MSSNLLPGHYHLVAVKTAFLNNYSNPDEAWGKMVVEARVMKFLDDLPSVPRVFGVFRQGDVCCMIQEFIGNTFTLSSTTFLDVLLTGQPSLSALECISMTSEVVIALNDMHKRGILHNDVAARNILIHHAGTSYRAKLTDFGMACRVQYPRAHRELTFSSLDELLQYNQDHPEVAPEKYLDGACDSVNGDVYSIGYGIRIVGVAIRSSEMVELGKSCTSFDAEDRPSLDWVINILDIIKENEKSNPTCRGINGP
ncbi:probable serine/threonine-protein kinase PknB [Antedon mediterranea]|uniref:probable serine/threonine-protein kinase PknB n=1 Tax=Antedon mediterranea TaxID=105859 RepID=UPI003AF4971E